MRPKMSKIKEMTYDKIILNVRSKKIIKHRSPMSPRIPTLRSTDNAGNSVNLVSGIIR